MPRHVDPDPIEELAAALAQTTAIKGHLAIYGDGDSARQTAPQRVVMQPDDGDFQVRAKQSASGAVDLDIGVTAEIWASSRGHAWDALRRLVQGVREHGKAGGPLVEWRTATWPRSEDTSAQGQVVVVRFVVRAQPIPPPEQITGLVEAVTIRST